ncbi:hypothetical protein ACIBCN_26680 [Nocardia sp. NPDC051052]|uniref:hypothetical protein n=1 Tax=Nocardia sp. NPDC051052 TaxID=3364322 RepID=UPI0037B01CDB
MSQREIVRYTRIESTPDGNSKFVDEELALTARTVAAGVPPMAISELSTAEALFVRSEGFDSAPHPAPRRQWVVMVRGAIEVTTGSGEKRVFGPGDLVLAADTDGLGHSTVALGDPPFEALFLPVPDGA